MNAKVWIPFILTLLAIGCSQQGDDQPGEEVAKPLLDQTRELYEKTRKQGESLITSGTNSVEKAVRELYEKAREAGDHVPTNVVEWAKEDLKNIGAWEYRIEQINLQDDKAVEARLNELGAERWEVYWVEKYASGARFHLKKSRRSYRKHVPLGDLLKSVTGGDGN